MLYYIVKLLHTDEEVEIQLENSCNDSKTNITKWEKWSKKENQILFFTNQHF
jgi:hypothetical protein